MSADAKIGTYMEINTSLQAPALQMSVWIQLRQQTLAVCNDSIVSLAAWGCCAVFWNLLHIVIQVWETHIVQLPYTYNIDWL